MTSPTGSHDETTQYVGSALHICMDFQKTLSELLSGNIPSGEIELVYSDKLYNSLQLALSQWHFVGSFFQASRGPGPRVPLIPLLYFLSLNVGLIPSTDTLVKILKKSPLVTSDPTARIWQCRTGFLRELDCGFKLLEYGRVFKNYQLDLTCGIDWIVRGQREYKIAVANSTNFSGHKKKKMDSDVITVFSERSEGVNLVSRTALDTILRTPAQIGPCQQK